MLEEQNKSLHENLEEHEKDIKALKENEVDVYKSFTNKEAFLTAENESLKKKQINLKENQINNIKTIEDLKNNINEIESN